MSLIAKSQTLPTINAADTMLQRLVQALFPRLPTRSYTVQNDDAKGAPRALSVLADCLHDGHAGH